jgi:hypothetical protein
MSDFKKPVRVNYLSNSYLLNEIHQSKVSYSYFLDPSYQTYQLILSSVQDITPSAVEEAKAIKAKRATQAAREQARAANVVRHSRAYADLVVDPAIYNASDVTFRVMTYQHIPLEPGRVKTPKKTADSHVALNFKPFSHYAYNDAGELQEVGRSHWQGGFENGHFSQDHGKLTNGLGRAFRLLTDRFGQKGNWRGYSYLDEMRGEALVQLSVGALKFDESRSDNPFSYYTRIANNAFIRVLNAEKRQASIRDDLLEASGQTPSLARQLRNDGR